MRREGRWSGRRDSNPRPPAWKARALPTELLPRSRSAPPRTAQASHQTTDSEDGGGGRIRTFEGVNQRVYSPSPLAAWVPHQHCVPRARNRRRRTMQGQQITTKPGADQLNPHARGASEGPPPCPTGAVRTWMRRAYAPHARRSFHSGRWERGGSPRFRRPLTTTRTARPPHRRRTVAASRRC